MRVRKAFERGYLGHTPKPAYTNAWLFDAFCKGMEARTEDEVSGVAEQKRIKMIRERKARSGYTPSKRPAGRPRASGRAAPGEGLSGGGRPFPGWGGRSPQRKGW